MSRLTVADLRGLLPTLGHRDFAALAVGTLGLRRPTDAVTDGQRLQMLLWAWLAHLGFVTDAQRRLLVTTLGQRLGACALELAAADAELPPRLLTVADRSWAALDGGPWLHLDTGAAADELPRRPVSLFSCDLVALWQAHLRALHARGEGGPRADTDRPG